MNQKLLLVRGTPGQGKSFFAKQMFNYFHLETDMFFMDDSGNYNWQPELLGTAHLWCQSSTHELLRKGYNVVVSNTFTTKKELKPYFEMAKEFDIIPVVIHCQNEFKSVHNVPEETIQKMKKRFEHDLSELWDMYLQ